MRSSARAQHQGQVAGFVARDSLPNDEQCDALFQRLVDLDAPTWALAMRLKHRSGVRWGELIALRAGDVRFTPRTVRIERAVEQSAHGRRLKAPKNSQTRTSIFPASLAADLAARVDVVRQRGGDDALLFPGRGGGLADRRQFLRLWHRGAALAGWPMHGPGRSVWHLHDLRHVAACWR